PAFVPLFLGMETGLLGAMYTGDLFSFFVFMELMVLSSVSLTAISDDRYGLEAALKYLLLSGMGTVFLLLGITAMYTTFGTLNMADMAQQLATGDRPLLARAAAFMLTSAFLLKSAVFPFHFWQPDFHTTAPTPVSAMLSSVVVKVGIYGIIRMLTLLFTQEAAQLESILVFLGIVGIFYGSLSALRTHNGKRLLAYSTIGQVGFILVAMGWGSDLALVAAIVYAFNHAFIKSALLMIMGLVASRTSPKTLELEKIRGAGRKMPAIIGVLWFVGGMSLSGLPPLNGFISKLTVVRSGVLVQDWLPLFLAVFAGIMTSMYMFGTWQHVFQQKNLRLEEVTNAPIKIKSEGDSPFAPLILIMVCVALGLYARPLISLAEQAVIQIGDPSIYINAVGLGGG
ncbi:MAG: complex I subunit 5 family protein, partial [Aggregatilineales bacterium]